jgi:hypothetical protein
VKALGNFMKKSAEKFQHPAAFESPFRWVLAALEALFMTALAAF